MVKYTLKQCGSLYDTDVKNKSYTSCKRRFHHKYPGVEVLTLSAIFKLVKTVHSTRSFLDKKYTRQYAVLRKSLMKLESD
jgi:hypothetical protein